MALPIRRLTLYKHGISVVERQGKVTGNQAVLTFQRQQMNDVLKSLVVYDRAGGRVLNIAYDAPEEREQKLERGSIHLSDHNTMLDLIRDLRGRAVRIKAKQAETEQTLTGTVMGLDISENLPFVQGRLSLLTEQGIELLRLHEVQQVALLDGRARTDLDFFLHTSITEEEERTVTVRLSEGTHDLVARYLTPSPTWRVSYRLVGEQREDGSRQALLQGWGIFDNPFDEPLEGVQVNLVSGMPISFVYDLYQPFTPERPVVEEEARVAPSPVEMEPGTRMKKIDSFPQMAEERVSMSRQDQSLGRRLLDTMEIETETEARDDQFEYRISHPVTVQRGEAAMVPILATEIPYRKEYIYNSRKLTRHPSVVLRFDNGSGLTLERGPITVIEGDSYIGEAIFPFTRPDAEVLLPVAADLGISIQEEESTSQESYRITFEGLALVFHEYITRQTTYEVRNSNPEGHSLLLEHPRLLRMELLNMPEPEEQTEEHYRWRVDVPAGPRGYTTFTVRERRPHRREERLYSLSAERLTEYLQKHWIDEAIAGGLRTILERFKEREKVVQRIEEIKTERERLLASQEQIRKNLGSLKSSGKEGELRSRYADQLNASEDSLVSLEKERNALQQQEKMLQQQVREVIDSLD